MGITSMEFHRVSQKGPKSYRYPDLGISIRIRYI
jgi:hypothetical protein